MSTFKFPSARFYVVPSQSLRNLINYHAERLLPGCNYILQWRDAQGYGIELARGVEWVPPGPVYRHGDERQICHNRLF